MNGDDRARILEQLADGRLPLREAAGMRTKDVATLAGMGRIAFEQRDFAGCLAIFTALEALESDRPEHTLRRAHAESRLKRKNEALASLRRFLETDRPKREAHVDDALELMAYLLRDDDPTAADALRTTVRTRRKRRAR